MILIGSTQRLRIMIINRLIVKNWRNFQQINVPLPTDSILNPKEILISLARRSKKKRLREALVPAQGATLSVGDEYNIRLIEFVRNHWDLERAATASPSLKPTLDRLAQEKNAGANQ